MLQKDPPVKFVAAERSTWASEGLRTIDISIREGDKVRYLSMTHTEAVEVHSLLAKVLYGGLEHYEYLQLRVSLPELGCE